VTGALFAQVMRSVFSVVALIIFCCDFRFVC